MDLSWYLTLLGTEQDLICQAKKIADKDILYYKALLFKHKIQGHDALCLEESKVIMKKGIIDVGGGILKRLPLVI